MRGRVVVGAFAIAAVLAAAAAFFLGGRGGGADSEGGLDAGGHPAAVAAPTLAAAPRAARSVAHGTCVLAGSVHEREANGRPVAAKVSIWREVPYEGGKPEPLTVESWRAGPRDTTAGPADATGTSDAAGRFEFAGLAPGQYLVAAETGETPPLRGREYARIPFDGGHEHVDLVVRPADLALVVRAKRADGSPWRVRVGVSGSTSTPVADTDEAGNVTFSGLGTGAIEVQVDSRAQGITLSVSVTMPRKDPLVVTEPAGLVTISGRVIESPAGTALPGARLSAGASTTQGWTMSTAEGGPDGTFRILVDPSADTVQASATGFADGQTKLHGKTSDLTIALHRKARVSGTVVEESTSKPVPGVHVLAAGPDEGGSFRRMRGFRNEDALEAGLGTTMTDASGRFTLELDAAGAVELRAIGNGWCSKGLGSAGGAGATLVEASTEAESVVTLEVARAAKVTGRVLDAEGKPAPGASAQAVLQVTTGGRRWSQAKAALPATAGEDGRFVLDAILPGVDVVVSARHGDVEGPPVAVGALEPGAEREVELRLARVRKVIVTVVGAADGKPVPGATVTLNGDNDGWQEETTDATGVVTFQGASGGALQASASGPDLSDAALGIHPFGGEATAEVPAVPDGAAALPDATVTIRLPDTATGGATAGRRTLSGTVRFPDGTPAAGAKVTTDGDDEGVVVANGSRFAGDAPSAAVGADGTFTVEPSEGDTVRLRASISRLGVEWSGTVEAAPGAKGLAITVTEPKDDDPATARVRVVDAEGKPVAAAKAQVKTTTSAGASSTSYGSEVTDGTLSLAVKSAETVEIRISDARDAMGSRLPVAFTKVGPVPVAQLPAEIRLVAEKTIDGFVRTPDGSPVAGVSVSAQTVADDAGPGAALRSARGLGRYYRAFFANGDSVAEARSGPDGAFRLRGLDAVEYQIVPVTPLGYVEDADRDLKARGGATGVSVTLRPGIAVVVRVLDAEGKPIAGASADAQPASSGDGHERDFARSFRRHNIRARLEAGSDASGTIRLDGLDAAVTYTLYVEPPEDRTDLQPREVAAWKPAGDTIRLDRSRSTRGMVKTPTGEPLGNATVEWTLSGPRATSGTVETGEDGRFVIPHTEEGQLELVASFGTAKGEPTSRSSVVVAAGAQDVALVVDPGAELTVRFDPPLAALDEMSIGEDGAEPGVAAGAPFLKVGDAYRFRGLVADHTYTVWASARRPSLVVLASGLRASVGTSAARGPVTLHPAPGRSITVRVVGPVGLGDVDASVQRGPASLSANSSQGGPTRTLRVDGLFEGRWHVEARGTVGDVQYEGHSEGDAGGEVEVRLEPQK